MTKQIRTLIFVIIFIAISILYTTAEALPYDGKLPLGVYWSYQNDTFQRISMCESSGKLDARNQHSSAKGEFQFIDSTWKHYGQEYWGDDFNTKDVLGKDNRELAWYVFQKYGTGDWNSSKHCWGKML